MGHSMGQNVGQMMGQMAGQKAGQMGQSGSDVSHFCYVFAGHPRARTPSYGGMSHVSHLSHGTHLDGTHGGTDGTSGVGQDKAYAPLRTLSRPTATTEVVRCN